MTDLIRAPFTAEQVAALNRFQQHGGMHPFTCGAFHTGSHVVLIARADGWHCSEPSCEYRQDWAHAFMAQPETWPKPLRLDARSAPEAAAGGLCPPGVHSLFDPCPGDCGLPLDGEAAEQAPADPGLRERYAVAIRERLRQAVVPEPSFPRLGQIGMLCGATEYDLADVVLAVRDAEVEQLRAEVERLHAAQMSTLGELAKAWGRRRRYRQAWQSARHRAQRLRARVADLEQHHKTLCTLVGERSEMVRSARDRVSVLESRAETALARLNLCGMALLHDGYFTEEDEIWPEIAPRITERLAKAREAEAAVARARAFAQELRDYCTPHGISALYADRLEAAIDGRQDPA